MAMKLSVIIPTRNRAHLLEKALSSLVAQTLSQSHFEVIVVDNGSTDNTADVVNSFKKSLTDIRYFLEFQPGLHVGRHKGLIEAESDLIVYADDDIEAFPTWLQAIQGSFEDEEVAMVGGKCLPCFEAEPPAWLKAMWSPSAAGERMLGYLSLMDLGNDIRTVDPHLVFGCNFAIRRPILVRAGGFHPDAMPQELIRFRGDGETCVSRFIQSNGHKAQYNPLASIYHWVPKNRMTTDYFCRRAYNQGISDSYSAIRQANCIGTEAVPVATIREFLRFKFVSGILATVSQMTSRVLRAKGQGAPAGEAVGLHRTLIAAYRRGYAYHQAEVGESGELLAWVLRPDYWGCQVPPPPAMPQEDFNQ